MNVIKKYEVVRDVRQPRHVVWQLLTDFEKWPQWTPTMTSVKRVSGENLGAKFDVKQPKLPAAQLTIVEWTEGKSFTWSSLKRLANMNAHHTLDEIEGSVTRVSLSVEMTGPLAGIVWSLWGRLIKRYVDTESASLKTAAEKQEQREG